MHKIIYVDGTLADNIGTIGLQALADVAAKTAEKPVTVLTHGHSRHHANQRIVGLPPCKAD